jgi:uncharacterized membrane protein YkvI
MKIRRYEDVKIRHQKCFHTRFIIVLGRVRFDLYDEKARFFLIKIKILMITAEVQVTKEHFWLPVWCGVSLSYHDKSSETF